ncbi:RabGAP/TBC domain-containing protein [Heterostelium album PN500]|uniref:RabGAP/TBC domain-containing protein n=1 Tax=Heterostelium pallidum (strain ATCC 26659 / Pp 5 / PN500) TaxID=670386 RepID=D3B2G2_HETP5|nr:RabGAP/TBC domain-containing protein [Heterostelium album PN500]EFA83510.1 RabGAP/TBC domain-containing protein [Heterostelium album PN500]|eukprot:XP_020435627.1 RabGAP/TBC domain-containing protein [Heterostelium album PN500]
MDTNNSQFTMSVDNATTSSENESTVVVGVIEAEVHEPKSVLNVPDVNVEFNSLFFSVAPLNKTPLEILKHNAYTGALATSTLRGLAWRIFLGCLNVDAIERWQQEITLQRSHYTKLLEEHYVDPRKETAVFDPLSNDENSPWNKFFRNRELQKTITLDIERTYPDNEFFQNQTTKEVCFVCFSCYSVCFACTEFEVDRFKKSDDAEKNPTLIDTIYDRNFLEHDLFTVFEALMKRASNWFGVTPNPNVSSPTATATTNNSSNNNSTSTTPNTSFTNLSNSLQSSSSTSTSTSSNPNSQTLSSLTTSFNILNTNEEQKKETTPVVINEAVQKCKNINKLLRQKDPELHAHLESLGIEPQIYLLRWIRLLFGREFHLEDVLKMWDSLFAYGEDLVLIDFVSISMLVYIREQLLQKDNSGVLKRLFKYPPVEDIYLLINQAFRIKDSHGPFNMNNNYNYQKASSKQQQQHQQKNVAGNGTSALPTSHQFKSPEQHGKNSPSNIFTPFSALLHDPLGTIASTTSKVATSITSTSPKGTSNNYSYSSSTSAYSSTATTPNIVGVSQSQSAPTTPMSAPVTTTTTTTTAPPPKVISSSATTSIYGESLFAKPATTVSTNSSDLKSRLVNISSSDLFESAKKDMEPLGFLTTSVSLSAARSNYESKRSSVAVTKVSTITPKAAINQEIKRLRNIQKYIGNSLGDIVPTLQAGFSENPSLINHDSLMLAVAQVKQIKDMLLGDLPLPENIPDYDEFDADTEDPLSSNDTI